MNNTTFVFSQTLLQSDLPEKVFLSLFAILSSAIVGGAITRYHERKVSSEAKLYYPMYLSCHGILNVLKNHETLGRDYSINLFKSCSKTLDAIIYVHGSVIYLKEAEYLNKFLEMKNLLDIEIMFLENRNWEAVIERFNKDEFSKIENNANILEIYCKKKVKSLSNISK